MLARVALGRMGTVYLAEQIDNQKKVALKILDAQYSANPEYVKDFCHSARLAAGLKHPNVATVLDFDQTADGCLFVVCDYVEGEPLDRVIEDAGRLDVARAVRFAEQIADGLAAAHRRGLLHKDIRPCNIMVTPDSQVKITDCGVSRPLEHSSSTRLTQADMRLATPEYTAPEQASGGEPSEQTDIYRLGIVLYEMLTGQVPFREATQLSTLLAQINDAPRPLRQLRREIPEALESLVMQCLEKKPAKRPLSMARLARDLKACSKAVETAAQAPVVVRTPVAIPMASPTATPSRASAKRQGMRWKAVSAVAWAWPLSLAIWDFSGSRCQCRGPPLLNRVRRRRRLAKLPRRCRLSRRAPKKPTGRCAPDPPTTKR
ncbi:MAG: serine/threonine protein kinase [Deltaproteobacteria bacterium]|nr:serine/threonine protein kinase [Deltaproteobacteria bacterium]